MLWVSAALMIVLLGVGLWGRGRHDRQLRCCGLAVELLDSSTSQFITAGQIRSIVDREYGGYVNVPVKDINLCEIEAVLQSQGILERHEAYFTGDGMLHIIAKQYTPVMKISGASGDWYLCRTGKYFRISRDWCKNIPVMSGRPLLENNEWMDRACRMGEYIVDKALTDSFRSIKCDERGEITLQKASREEVFQIGQPSNFPGKLNRIEKYEKMVSRGLVKGKEYKNVNVKYDGQIVCK